MHDTSLEYWQNLCPDLTVSVNEVRLPIHETAIQDVTENLIKEGYFHVPFDSWDLPLDKMADCITKLKQNNIEPAWCFIYDEFWILTTRVHSYIESVLGKNYYKLPDVWAWHVDPAKEERGWKVHRDRGPGALFDDGLPKSLTIWIPLTDTTVENGCMHVLPQSKDPNYRNDDEPYYADWEEHFYTDDKIAMEAKAGDLLGWNQQLLHWGGAPTNTKASPRISVSVEFVARYVLRLQDHESTYPIKPWLDPFTIPSLDQKIELIHTVRNRYKHMWDHK